MGETGANLKCLNSKSFEEYLFTGELIEIGLKDIG